jgi:two-component system nitrate/nitrite sensor histidine kinase NarX
MQTLDIAQEAPMTLNDDEMGDCCSAYKLLNTTLFGILAKPESVDPYIAILDGIKSIISVQTSAIYHFSTAAPQATLVASSGNISSFASTIQIFARSLVHDSPASAPWYSGKKSPNLLIKAARIKGDTTNEYAVLALICNNPQKLRETRVKVIEILAQGFSDVFCATRLAQVNRRRALQEERATISRELHDSLAQSLTYLKIQASRIQSILKHEQSENQYDTTQVELVVHELRDNLNLAYRQLRELMTIFRLTMNGEDFNQAIEESIAEFEKRSSIAFELDNRLDSEELTTNEEMQIQHIVREALSNIVRHSHARRAGVALRHRDDNNVQISIKDDGVGIDETQRRAQHHGLIIMQERSQNLNGKFSVDQQIGGGTKITITFKPRKTGDAAQQKPLLTQFTTGANND